MSIPDYSTDPVVRTRHGLVRGTAAAVKGVSVFKGIPYAASTAGENRWRAPQPPTSWDGIRSAEEFGPICPQNQPSPLAMSEDCLSVNVWTTDVSAGAAPRPVLVWIYGGRFIWGSGSDSLYDGAGLAAQGLVVVTLNYRTGVFGFLATPELSEESKQGASGNYGLLDQIAALEWVRGNIAAFGGDPERVTIGGQSAGAACVMDLVYSPLADGLLHGAIAESGALFPSDPGLAYLAASYRERPTAEEEGSRYVAEHGGGGLAVLRRLPIAELLEGNDADEVGTAAHRPPLFRPVLDGWVLPRSYSETLHAGLQSDVPVITGTNSDEDGASPHPRISRDGYIRRAEAEYGDFADEFLTLYPAGDDLEAGEMSNAAARDHSRTSSFLWASLWAEHATSSVFTYFWTHAAPGPEADVRGAFHGSEINYFLGNLYGTDRPWTATDEAIAEMMSAYVVNFVATGNPNGQGLPAWTAVDPMRPLTMAVGDSFLPIPVAAPERFDWQRRFLESRVLFR